MVDHDKLVALLEDALCVCATHGITEHCGWCKRRKATLSALKSREVVLVPREPTEEMLIAGGTAWVKWYADDNADQEMLAGDIYRAMLRSVEED